MIIALSGHRGFIGSNIKKTFSDHTFILVNRDELYGDYRSLAEKIAGADVVINSAGFSVSSRWTKKNKKHIYDSRIKVTNNLVKAINSLTKKPDLFINNSGIALYEYDKKHTESDYSCNDDFLAEVVKEWEKSANAVDKNVKLIIIRLGLVLGKDGGAMPRLLRLFRMGLGGVLASGKQVYSFIHIDDVTRALEYLMIYNNKGVYNFTAPFPVTNREFTKALGKILNRPSIFRVPRFVLKLIMGEGAVLVTKGQSVYPQNLLDAGFVFTFGTIDKAIENLVSKR
ncbi:MAG: TIGR01777 family oxidoreductase [Bacteroidales bacterium]